MIGTAISPPYFIYKRSALLLMVLACIAPRTMLGVFTGYLIAHASNPFVEKISSVTGTGRSTAIFTYYIALGLLIAIIAGPMFYPYVREALVRFSSQIRDFENYLKSVSWWRLAVDGILKLLDHTWKFIKEIFLKIIFLFVGLFSINSDPSESPVVSYGIYYFISYKFAHKILQILHIIFFYGLFFAFHFLRFPEEACRSELSSNSSSTSLNDYLRPFLHGQIVESTIYMMVLSLIGWPLFGSRELSMIFGFLGGLVLSVTYLGPGVIGVIGTFTCYLVSGKTSAFVYMAACLIMILVDENIIRGWTVRDPLQVTDIDILFIYCVCFEVLNHLGYIGFGVSCLLYLPAVALYGYWKISSSKYMNILNISPIREDIP